MKLEKEYLIKIQGGGILSGAVISALLKSVGTILDLGRSLGSAIRRISAKNVCSISN